MPQKTSTSINYEPHIVSDPLFPFIFHVDTVRAGERYCVPNWHSNTEILHVTFGKGIVCLDAKEYAVEAGDVVVINSNVLHSTYGLSEHQLFIYDCLIPDSGFCRAAGIDTVELVFEPVIHDPALNSCLNRVRTSFSETGVCRAAKIQCAVLETLIFLREQHTLCTQKPENPAQSHSDRIKETMLFMRQNLGRTLTLEEIAAHIGISKYHFSREFKQVTGKTPVEYLNMTRCTEAGQMIRDGASVSQAALRCGFENLSYFTRTYKKYMGELPSKAGK